MLESFFPRVGREEEGEGSCCVETSGSLLSDPQSGIVDRFFFPSKNYDLESLSCYEYFSPYVVARMIELFTTRDVDRGVDSFTRDEIGNYVIFAGDHDNLVND